MPLTQDDVGKVVKQWQRCRSKKDPYDSFVLEMLQYLCPRLTNKIMGRIASGSKQTSLQFDGTGEDAGQKLAANLAGTLISPSQQWFRLVPRQYELRVYPAFMRWLEECADRLYASFNNSNLQMEAAESFLSLVYTGTDAMLHDEATQSRPGEFGGHRFKTLGYGEFCYEEDAFGMVNKLYRNFDISYGAAAAIPGWLERMPIEARNKAQNSPEEEFEMLHVVYPRSNYNRRRSDYLNMPFGSCYVMTRGNHLLYEGGYNEFSYSVTRWSKSPGELYGRGPGHRAYADVRSQNRLVQIDLEAGSKAVDPVLLVLHEAIMGDATLNPAGINPVDGAMVGNDVRRAVAPLESNANFAWSADRMDRLDKKVRSSFHNDHIQPPELDRQSATEYAGRLEALQRQVGSTFGRIYFEKLSPIVNRGFNMMLRAGAFPPPPNIPKQFAGSPIDVVFEGPMARAQRSHDLIAIQRKNEWLQFQIAIGNTAVVDLFDADAEGRELAEITGLPANLVRDPEAIAAIRAAKADAARKQEMLNKTEQVLGAAGKAAPALKQMPRTSQQLDTALSNGNGGR